jgi:primosomal protein N'
VVVQTREPDGPVALAIAAWDPSAYWRHEAPLRDELAWPPGGRLVQLDAPAEHKQAVGGELVDAVGAHAMVLGPLRDGDRVRWLAKTDDVPHLLAALDGLRRQWSRDNLDVRVDVDPVEPG